MKKLFSNAKKRLLFPTGQDRKLTNSTMANVTHRTDANLRDRVSKFTDLISKKKKKKKKTYRIPLRFLRDIGLSNHLRKLDTKIVCTLETDLNKLFESNKQVNTITAPNAQIIWHDAPYIQYEQFRLNDNFREYLKTIILPKKLFRLGIQKTHPQKFHELSIGAQSYTVEFIPANRQFDWLEISLVFDKNDKHSTIYHSYNAEVESTLTQNISTENVENTFSVANELKYDITSSLLSREIVMDALLRG